MAFLLDTTSASFWINMIGWTVIGFILGFIFTGIAISPVLAANNREKEKLRKDRKQFEEAMTTAFANYESSMNDLAASRETVIALATKLSKTIYIMDPELKPQADAIVKEAANLPRFDVKA
jgi:hypothetical protein